MSRLLFHLRQAAYVPQNRAAELYRDKEFITSRIL